MEKKPHIIIIINYNVLRNVTWVVLGDSCYWHGGLNENETTLLVILLSCLPPFLLGASN